MQLGNINVYRQFVVKQSASQKPEQSEDVEKKEECVSGSSDKLDERNEDSKPEEKKEDLLKYDRPDISDLSGNFDIFLNKPQILTIGSGKNTTVSYEDLSQLFGGTDKLDRITAFDICGKLDEMLASDNPRLRRFANMLNNAFNSYNISDREDLKVYLLQEIISKISQQNDWTLSGIGGYNLEPEHLLDLLNNDSFFVSLQGILNSSELHDAMEGGFDSTIGSFVQNGAGPCWMFSGLKALSASTTGQELIRNSMSWAPDRSSVTIYFQGVNKSYNISLTELMENRHMYAFGDIEAVAFAMATEMLRRDIKEENVEVTDHNNYNYVNKDDNGNPSEGLTSGNTTQFFYFLTGKYEDSTGNAQGNNIVSPTPENLARLLEDGLIHYSAIATIEGPDLARFYRNYNYNNLNENQLSELEATDENGNPRHGHAFAITGISNGTVTVTDPSSTVSVELSWSEFCHYFETITQLYMHGETIQGFPVYEEAAHNPGDPIRKYNMG